MKALKKNYLPTFAHSFVRVLEILSEAKANGTVLRVEDKEAMHLIEDAAKVFLIGVNDGEFESIMGLDWEEEAKNETVAERLIRKVGE